MEKTELLCIRKYSGVIFLGAGWLFVLYFFIRYIFLIQSYSLDIGGMENVVVYYLTLLKEKGGLYHEMDQFPYSQTLYPPLYFYLTDAISNLFNIEDFDVRGLILTGRFFNLFINICNCALLFVIFRLYNVGFAGSTFALVFYLMHIPEHSFAFRVDTLKDFFFILTLVSLLYYKESKSIIFAISSLFFALLSTYTKQDAIIFILPLYSIVLYDVRWKLKVLLVGSLVSLIVIAGIVLNIYTNGHFFSNMIVANIEFSYDFLPRWINDIKFNVICILPFVALCLFYKRKGSQFYMLCVLAILYLIISILTSTRFGAAQNYYSIFYIMLSVLLGVVISGFDLLSKLSFRNTVLLTLFAILFVFNFNLPKRISPKDEKVHFMYYQSVENISLYLKANHNDIRVLSMPPDFLAFLPVDMVYKAYNFMFQDFLYVNYSFEGREKVVLHDIVDNSNINGVISEVDLLILPKNDRSVVLYNRQYSEEFKYLVNTNFFYIFTKSESLSLTLSDELSTL